jgi:hypothetical protein
VRVYAACSYLCTQLALRIRAQILSAQDFDGHAQPTDEADIYEKARAQIHPAQELQSPALPTVMWVEGSSSADMSMRTRNIIVWAAIARATTNNCWWRRGKRRQQ